MHRSGTTPWRSYPDSLEVWNYLGAISHTTCGQERQPRQKIVIHAPTNLYTICTAQRHTIDRHALHHA